MEISQRLKTVAGFVKYKTIADIGTDHGYIPCYLALNEKITRAIACDINDGPLGKARENVKANGLDEIIETRLGPGLLPLHKSEAETVIIAGMGGILICDILFEGMDILGGVKQLIVQPQRDVYRVRKFLHKIGFMIEDEEMVYEAGKFYNIISAVRGSERYSDEISYIFGKRLMEKKSAVLYMYLNAEIEKYSSILNSTSVRPENSAGLEKIRVNMALSQEVLKRYEAD
ncbi:class I SAM-dependent methyltransferase [Lachnospiraceae bacterium NSJ-143]|nr:class I SAM-dependent methyltransferase [Lachnospiraceae bacterium NSJ-143]